MSAAENKAVFLSYASQDAEAARRICDALRSGGVEVWFDADGGLEHGDEWDQKIRKQIKDCVLFIAVISANTQAREEGYFRLEWDLAAERARTIASGVPFILPVVIDDTREPAALVPDRFRAVQWTRLPGGAVSADVLARFLKLWSHRTGLLKSKSSANPSPDSDSAAFASPTPTKARWPLVVGISVAVVAVGVGFFLAMRSAPPPVAAATASKAPAPPTSPAPSKRYASSRPEVAALLTHVQAMTDKADVARAELETALSLLDQAAKLDSADANVSAERALVEFRYVTSNLDNTPARIDAALQHAKQAISLDPKNSNARLADGLRQIRAATNRASGEAVAAIFESLIAEGTERADAYFALAQLKLRFRKNDEAFALLDQAARLPGAAGRAATAKAIAYSGMKEWAKANTALDEALALERSANALLWKSYFATIWLGDAALAKQAIADIPPGILTEDFPASGKLFVALWAHDWATAIATMRTIPRTYIGSGALSGPTGYYIGYALDRAGRKSAAEIEWRSALEVVNRRFENDPRGQTLFTMKALLQASLGDRAGAEKTLQTLRELYPTNWDRTWEGHMLAMELLPPEEAIAHLADPNRFVMAACLSGCLKLDPFIDHLRSHPKFAEVLANAESNPKLNPAAAPAPAGKTAPASRPTAMSAATTPDDKSVAVLAFANLSDDKDNEYFSDGISEELLTVLQKIPGLHVAARTSAFSFKGKNATAQEIGEKLSVAHLVEGSVQKSGKRVKITARLSKAATGEELWSKSFGPLELTDVFATQSEIAQAIVGELRGRLGGEAAATAKAEIQAQVSAAEKGSTKNVEAHQLYLQGKFLALRYSRESILRAVALFRRAIELDDSFALAWAALATTTTEQGNYGISDRPIAERYAEARDAAQRALRLEPDLAEGYLALMAVQWHDFDWKGVRASARRALELAPSDATTLMNASAAENLFENFDRAAELARRGAALDPFNIPVRFGMIAVFWDSGKIPEAEAETRRLLDLNPTALNQNLMLGLLVALQGRADEAGEIFEREKDELNLNVGRAIARWAQKKPAEADAALKIVIERGADKVAFQIAEIYGFRHDVDQTFVWLERAYRQHDVGIAYTRVDRFFAPLHADPRWPVFLKKIGLADEQLK